MPDKETYSPFRGPLYLSMLDPVTFERQAFLNKLYLGLIVVLFVAVVNLAVKFYALDAEIAVRRASSNARVQQWNALVTQDSLQRIAWEIAKTKQLGEIARRQKDSILNQIGSR